MTVRNPRVQHLLSVVVIVTAFFALYSPILSAPFWAVDEWEVLSFSTSTPLHPQLAASRPGLNSLDDFTQYIISDFQREGRFRPMWHIPRFVQAALFGSNAVAWHVMLLLMGSATMILCYAAARAARMGWLAAFLIPMWMIVSPQASEIWSRVGPNETSGMVFLALSVFAGVKAAARTSLNRWDWVMLVALALAGLSKESLALAGPAVVFGRAGLAVFWSGIHWRVMARQLWPVLVGGLGVTVALLGLIWLVSRAGGWGVSVVSLSLQSFLPWNWIIDLYGISPLVLFFAPAFLAFVIAPNWPNVRISSPWLLAGYAAFALWVIPQLILYQATVLTGRFLYPVLAGVVTLNGWGVDTLARKRLWALLAPLLVVIGLVLGRQAIDLYNEAGRISARAQAFDDMLKAAASTVGDRAIVIAADPALVPEWICAIPSLLGSKGVQNALYLQPVIESEELAAAQAMGYLVRCLGGESFVTTENLDTADVGAVILLSSLDGFAASAPAWFQASEWQSVDHTRTFETLRFNSSAPPASVTFTTLEPAAP